MDSLIDIQLKAIENSKALDELEKLVTKMEKEFEEQTKNSSETKPLENTVTSP